MEYVEPGTARTMKGLRLALTTGVPGPWGEAAKAVFHVKGIPFVPVRQTASEANEALVAWTGFRNAPQAIYDEEPPRIGWEEILALAERLAPEPPLLPTDERERALVLGLSHALCSEDGLGWNRRLQLLTPMLSRPDARDNPAFAGMWVLARDYAWSPEASERANRRVVSILELFTDQLDRQQAAGREYLVGESLSAVDLYWATFCAIVRPLDATLCPMPEPLRMSYSMTTPEVDAALDPRLLAHRDRIYERYLTLPLEF